MINAKIAGMLVAAFVAGSFVASPELRAYAANTIGSSDIINESIQSEDIKNSQVKAADIADNAVGSGEIAANAVGASELKDVAFLKWVDCPVAFHNYQPGGFNRVTCSVPGADNSDRVVASPNGGGIGGCITMREIQPITDSVLVDFVNTCNFAIGSSGSIGMIVFDN